MAKVSLRIYNREIEGLIDQGRTDEAIAHCQHILKTFSKHLETYRLLGKAFLESKRYNEAVDIFSRVLMSVPEDFVSHVGMSIIRDEENKLDDSIWHMERAFEAQPSNAAIQGELQRLYGRRDGMEPPKIRMTRGALAHMYVQGELYPQAIAEIRAVLSQDAQRTDMQVLLARSFFRGGQKADASDMCVQLLKRYSYNFDANRIMVELLPATAGAAESTQVYRMRVGELDPYAIFSKGSVFQSTEVADAAINLERLEYTGEEVPMDKEWGASLGLGASAAPALSASASSDQPDWLKSAGLTESQPVSAPSTAAGDGIPDFLRAAGWGESNSPEQPTSIFDDEPAAGDLTPADMPDWLKGQVPTNVAAIPSTPQPAPEQLIETPDWLTGLGDMPADSAQGAKTLSSDVPDWLSGLGDAQSDQPTSAPAGDTSDWLSGLGDSQPAEIESAQPGNIPDWLSGLDTPQTSEPEPIQAGDLPDWLSGLDDSQPVAVQPAQVVDVSDWLSGLDNEPVAATSDIPDWLGDMDKDKNDQPVQPTSSIESLGSSAQEQDDAVAWLESLAAKHGAKPEELVTDPSKRNETPPEWVSQAQTLHEQTPAATVESLGSSAQEQDDAVAWLESLAAKHGAKPEELVTDPSKRNETPPEWVSQAQTLHEQTPAATIESLGSSAQEQDDAVAWLESLAAKHGAKPEELVTDPSKRNETPPEWVSQAQTLHQQEPAPQAEKSEWVEGAQNIGEQFFAEFENPVADESVVSATDETGMWLRGLDEQDAEEEKNLQKSDIPDWLKDSAEPNNIDRNFEFAGEPAAQRSDLPNWLDDKSDSAPQSSFGEQDVSQNDLSNWLSGLDDEPGLPFNTMPTPDSILTTPKSAPPVAQKSDLPDWLSGVDAKSNDFEDDWKKSIAEAESLAVGSIATDEPVAANLTDDLPDWLQGVDDDEALNPADDNDDTPPWQHREAYEAGEIQQPTPTSPSDWHPIELKPVSESQPVAQQPVVEPVKKQTAPIAEVRKPLVPQDVPSPEPVSARPTVAASKPVSKSETPAKKKAGLPPRQRQPEAQNVIVALNQAKSELDRGDIPTALEHYGKLIKKGKHLEETIRDLTESIYRYPVEVGIWQTLGDAYMRANRLKEALEAYNKAEELIR